MFIPLCGGADEDKEKDMQIGFPTDVKHVAHIGWDGPSIDNPSWVNNFLFFYPFSFACYISCVRRSSSSISLVIHHIVTIRNVSNQFFLY